MIQGPKGELQWTFVPEVTLVEVSSSLSSSSGDHVCVDQGGGVGRGGETASSSLVVPGCMAEHLLHRLGAAALAQTLHLLGCRKGTCWTTLIECKV